MKKLKNENAISEETYNKLRPICSKPGTLHGSAKAHKPFKNGLPQFRPILSVIGTPTYKLAKFLVTDLSDITQNEFTIKDSVTFVDGILTQNSDVYIASLDVDAIFTNIPVDKTIDIAVKKLFKTPDTLVKGISKNYFRDLLNLATKESFFTFNNKFYIQVDGVAMGCPLGPILANIFLLHHEENWLNKCPKEFKPSFHRSYVDDIFVLFELPESAHSFREYMISQHHNINFTVEQGNIGSLSFLDVKSCRKKGKFVTNVYRKQTFNGVFTNYESFIATYQKRGLLQRLLYRSFSICCDFKTFHFEIDHLKTILIKNKYPSNFMDSCIKSFLNKLYTLKVMVPNVPKRKVLVKLPFLGSTLFEIQKKLQKLFSDKLKSCNLKIVFASPVRVKSFFTFKDILPKMLLSGLVYNCKCNASYYGKTKRHFKIRISEYLGISHLTGKKGKD